MRCHRWVGTCPCDCFPGSPQELLCQNSSWAGNLRPLSKDGSLKFFILLTLTKLIGPAFKIFRKFWGLFSKDWKINISGAAFGGAIRAQLRPAKRVFLQICWKQQMFFQSTWTNACSHVSKSAYYCCSKNSASIRDANYQSSNNFVTTS